MRALKNGEWTPWNWRRRLLIAPCEGADIEPLVERHEPVVLTKLAHMYHFFVFFGHRRIRMRIFEHESQRLRTAFVLTPVWNIYSLGFARPNNHVG